MTYSDRARAFAALHQPGNPVVLYNIWDAGSAKAIAGAGAAALATGSYPVAVAQGFADGEQIPLEFVLGNAERIIAATDLPVTIDFEGGYARAPEQLTANVKRLAETGAVGLNFEDQVVGTADLYGIEEQARRVAAVRAANADIFVNARTDLFLKEKDTSKHAGLMAETLERGAAYAEAGGNGYFIPGLTDPDLIAQVCEGCSLPVNTMMRGITLETARQAGVARCSYGPIPHAKLMQVLAEHFQTLV
ncbi:isocitrate lyase/phosphoenolpyruvate mutase family protein [Leisingera sp. M527]|uniref:isocitrate lyase/PEP mutase family protein n=1 Tax=unclassified Leisingera TaxID=2614906 RepID=UPI0021A38E4B|nr:MULTISPECIES: isocitrate lyase/phosphoenolpyruvate mutase family protein [unclassified Leisingera]UWQ32575.1 isocitrate lyase/phosphoenolpyruvate mutase family protein [Leisingera sp. M527]UWQ74535.1 isocitrate lyase/phosphoenolpyruvate mutase family protein [Leisingera sp. M658]